MSIHQIYLIAPKGNRAGGCGDYGNTFRVFLSNVTCTSSAQTIRKTYKTSERELEISTGAKSILGEELRLSNRSKRGEPFISGWEFPGKA